MLDNNLKEKLHCYIDNVDEKKLAATPTTLKNALQKRGQIAKKIKEI
ncbi:MAG: hypothetical protein QM541_11830 [Flavobacterium sp.]|nr:hypothetical protein [Flavobacterium sp.]